MFAYGFLRMGRCMFTTRQLIGLRMPKYILDLKPRDCRFPVDGGFCAEHAESGPYCSHHRTIAYDPNSALKNSRLNRSLRQIIKRGL